MPRLCLRSFSENMSRLLLVFAANAFCSSGDADGENGLSPLALLLLLPRGLRKGDSAELGLKFRDEPDRGDEEK